MKLTKASELHEFIYEYDCYRTSPSDMSVIFGCDCGCGGDIYTYEEWDQAHEESDRVKSQFRELCDQLGLEYDMCDD